MTHVWWGRNTRRAAPQLERESDREAISLAERLNRLETRVERVELDNAERQVAVLGSLEKVLNQLRSREAKRVRDAEVEDSEPARDPQAGPRLAGVDSRPGAVPRLESTAHLARRFRQGL